MAARKSPLPDVYTAPLKPEYRPDLAPITPLTRELRYEAAAGSVAALIDSFITYPIDVARTICARDSDSDWISIIFERAVRLGPWSLFRCIGLIVLEPPKRLYRFVSLRHLRAHYEPLTPLAIARTAARIGVVEGYYFGLFEVLKNAIDMDDHWNPVVNLYRALHGLYSRPAAFVTSWIGFAVRNMIWNFAYYLTMYHAARISRSIVEPVLREPLLVHTVNVTCAAAVAAALTAPVDALRIQLIATRPRLQLIPSFMIRAVTTLKWRLWSSWPAIVTRAALGGAVFYGFYHHFVATRPDWSDWLSHPSRMRNLAELTMYITESMPVIEKPGAVVIKLLTNPFGLFDEMYPEPVGMK